MDGRCWDQLEKLESVLALGMTNRQEARELHLANGPAAEHS